MPMTAAVSPASAKPAMSGRPGRRSMKLYAAKAAHRHESGAAERDLPGISREEVEPQSCQTDGEEGRQDRIEQIIRMDLRYEEREDRQHNEGSAVAEGARQAGGRNGTVENGAAHGSDPFDQLLPEQPRRPDE